MRCLKKTLLTLLVPSFLLLIFVLPSSASAAPVLQPWWQIQQNVTPTDVSNANERGEVQSISLNTAGKGSAFEVSVGAITAAFATNETLAKEQGVALLTPARLQKALEGAYGKGNVKVTEQPEPLNNSEMMLIESVKADLTVTVAPIVIKQLAGAASVSVHKPVPAGEIVIRAIDMGDGPIEGERVPVRIEDMLPAGLQATEISGTVRGWRENSGQKSDNPPNGYGNVTCSPAPKPVCEYAEDAIAFNLIEVRIPVTVTGPEPAEGQNTVSVTGGGGAPVSRSQKMMVAQAPAPFGIEDESFSIAAEEAGGAPDTQAGSHPYQLTTAFTFENIGEEGAEQAAQPRNLHFLTPPGLVGNAQLLPRCSIAQFDQPVQAACPADTAVGVAVEVISAQVGNGLTGIGAVPVFNLDPGPGEPARFAFLFGGQPIYLTTSVRSGGDYGVTVDVSNITQLIAFSSSVVTFWGAPNSPSHNGQRGYACLQGEPSCEANVELPQKAFLTMPDSCEAPFQSVMEANAWTQPAYLPPIDSTFQETLDGCNRVPFSPSVEVAPDVQSASSASGLTAHVRLPQTISEDPEALGEGTIKNTTVALPAGVQLNPSDSGGLEACSESQIGYLNQTGPHGELEFTGTLPAGWEEGEGGFCPKAAKIGTVSIKTPLLKEPVKGAIYLASPAPNGEAGQNPFNSLVAMYIVAEDREAGIAVKLPGKVALCQGAGETIAGVACGAQGQLISTFQNTPQLPFEDLELHFFGGERSPLSTPAHCGAYTTQASFEPWSGGVFPASSTFDVTSGAHGSACPGTLPFGPSLTAGTTSNNAGNLSPFTMTMSRQDGNQNLQAISLHMPPGLSGLLSKVALCGEAQANAGTCGAESLIGETTVSVGVGNEPYTVTGGRVYLTEKYEGAPFGLSIVNPANAGPFHLGNVIVRAKIEVNPITAELTVTSDNSGPYKIPTSIDGIPLQIQHVNVTINRPGFTFNPTDCEPMKITGSLSSAEGATSALSVPFQVTNCAALGFKPSFKVSTSGKTSRLMGASLHVSLAYPKAAFGSQANIKSVKVDLPRQLPSNLEALKHACIDTTFEANPAACPAESKVGEAKAVTPLLPVPLTGPAYFVSHGGAKFPELIVVLQGYGVTVELHGETFISNAGITSSTFRSVPDVPVGTFELTLPQRNKYAALAAPGGLCNLTKTKIVKKKVAKRVHGKLVRKHGKLVKVTKRVKKTVAGSLAMPTAFTAQNGMTIHQNTPIEVTGCPRHKASKAKTSRHAKHHKRK